MATASAARAARPNLWRDWGPTEGRSRDEVSRRPARVAGAAAAVGARPATAAPLGAGPAGTAVGGLPHGYFDEIALQADWYTGDCVFEMPGEHKITDLDWAQTHMETLPNGDVIVHGRIATPRGPIVKRLNFHGGKAAVDFDILFEWDQWPAGSLRLGHFTLLPDAFDLDGLSFRTSNGGALEDFALDGVVDHGAPVSMLVSSGMGLGLTEGWLDIGDAATRLRIKVDRTTAPLLGMMTHRPVRDHHHRRSLFCQVQLSAAELDDTRKPASYRDGPRRFRFSLAAA